MTPNASADRIALGLRVFGMLGLALIIGRVVQLQVFPGEDLRAAINSRTTGSQIEPIRGDLLDRRGRLLATSRVAWRVVVDPVAAEGDVHRVITALSGAIDASSDDIGQRIMRATIENQRRRDTRPPVETEEPSGIFASIGLAPPSRPAGPERGLIRYVPIDAPVSRAQADAVRGLRLPGVLLERRAVREQVGGEQIAPLIGKVGYEDRSTRRIGLVGAESLFQDRLEGQAGVLGYVRDGRGRAIWVDQGAWHEAERGDDLRLSLDAEIQRIVTEELEAGMLAADAAGARAVVLDPHSGEILAMVDLMRTPEDAQPYPWHDPESEEPKGVAPDPESARWIVLRDDPARAIEPALGRNRCVEEVYEPGSTFKPFVWSLAKSKGLLPEDEIIEAEFRAMKTWYGRRLEDVTHRREMTWDDVLRYSSNIGMYNATERLTQEQLRAFVLRLGFGQSTQSGLPGEASGLVTSARNWNHLTQTSVGMGYEIGVTPVQMVRGFSIFAREGDQSGTLPGIRLTASGLDDRPGLVGDEIFVERVLDPETARAAREPMSGVVERMDAARFRKNPDDTPVRYSMFGKSGTAYIAATPPPGFERPKNHPGYFKKQYNSSFLAAAPLEAPELVVLVVIDDPGPALIARRHHYGSHVAGPVVRRIVERTLPYLGVPVPTSEPDSENAR